MWDTKCLDWRERLLSGSSLVPDLPLFDDEAQRALRIFKRLRLPDVPKNPTMAEAFDGADWVFDLVLAIFGSYDVETNRRMIQEFFLLIPKKNGKSTIAAAIMVVAIIMNRRPLAELLLVAPTKTVADIAFRQAAGIIRLDPELTKLFHPQRHIRTITHLRSGAMLVIQAADTDVITGSKSTFILVDETHEFGKKAKAADVFIEIRGALAARPDGFMIQITTQSKEPPAGVFKAELQLARDIRDGKVSYPMLAVLYELPDDMAAGDGWKRRDRWRLVNPNMDRSVDEMFLANQLVKAEREGIAALALLASQHFNVEVGLALKTDRWRGADYWERQADRTLTLAKLLERCEVIVAAVDGGGLDDMLALCLIGRERDTRRWLSWNKTWLHRSVLELRKSEASRFLDFEKAGELVIVDDMLHAFGDLAGCIQAVEEAGLLPDKNAVGLDPMGVGLIIEALAEIGISAESGRAIGIPQGWKLNGAIKTTEVKLASGELWHGGQLLTAWAVGNAKVEPKGNAITITKQTAGTAKIDPLMATIIGVAVMSLTPDACDVRAMIA